MRSKSSPPALLGPASLGPASLGLAALALVSLGLTAAPAHAQTQDMFVSNLGSGTISRFAGTGPGTFSTTSTVLSGGDLKLPQGLAFDANGDLFVANENSARTINNGQGDIIEFTAGARPGTFGATTTLTDPSLNYPFGLAFDSRGDLFTANFIGNSITEFTAGAAPGTFGMTSTLSGGSLSNPYGLAIDPRGDLFATDLNSNAITEFAAGAMPGTFGPATTFATGLNNPRGLAVDARGDLFAANANTITEYAFNATSGMFGPATRFANVGGGGLAFDARGDLFATDDSSTITEFAFNSVTGTLGAAQTIETGQNDPVALAFGTPAPPPLVPEASTTVSLGLLLALGLGGVVVGKRRRKVAP